MPISDPEAQAPSLDRVSNRYELRALLGKGGMACVYSAFDISLGREVALKQLTIDDDRAERTSAVSLFEREFHTLAQLRHPHVISVYDYGIGPDGSPYYTMELLDGGDLRERAPVDWREACRLIFDVCSSLALLHSRRLLHRDISPRNVRCTREGRAKLIDFGAMAPMNAGGTEIVGTPAFCAPETLHRLALDARTDLYSLGVTLYHALTARLPYPARTFADVMAAWSGKVAPPSALVPEIPAALDDLVLSLISLEPALRPHSAFDVMQRLAACAGLHASESEAVSRAYLATPNLVGRADVLTQLHNRLVSARVASGQAVLIDGPPGVGRSRVLDACLLDAQTLGFTVLRANASGTREAFASVRALLTHLLAALPDHEALREYPQLFTTTARAAVDSPDKEPANDQTRFALRAFTDTPSSTGQLQDAVCQLLSRVSRMHPLLIAVDDVHRIDEPSAALLAQLVDKTRRGGLLVVLTADSDEASSHALGVLSQRCRAHHLVPLTHEETHGLLGSLFGDVPHLDMLATEVFKVALGNPRQCLDIAQYAVDRGAIRYAAGIWTLPDRLAIDDLPSSAAAALHARIAGFSAESRFLAEAHALAYYGTLRDQDYRALLPDVSAARIEQALSQLLEAGAIVRDGSTYLLANRVWSAAFLAALDRDDIQARHRALVEMYRGTSEIAQVHHSFAGGLKEQGLKSMLQRNGLFGAGLDHKQLLELNVGKMMWCYESAIETAIALGYSRRDVYELRRWQYGGSITTEDIDCRESAQLWLERLIEDTGLDLFRRDEANQDAGARLTAALQGAQQRHLATPEHERVYSVEEALRRMAEYVVYSIAIGGRTQNAALLRSLPPLLEPFTVLSPILKIMWMNATATCASNSDCRYEQARDKWREALGMLDALVDRDASYIVPMGNAIAYAVGLMDAQLGLASAADWAERLDADPYQRVAALNLRKVVCLQQGDSRSADRLRRNAEVLALQMSSPQMFKTLLSVELAIYAKMRDLAGIARVIEQMKPLAARHPAWQANLIVAEANFDLVRGDNGSAEVKFRSLIAIAQPGAEDRLSNLAMWVTASAGLAEALLGSDRVEDARAVAQSALAICEARQISAHSFDLIRMLALAEARLEQAGSIERLDALIAEQTRIGATGLQLGLSYETRARIAICMADAVAFEQYASLTAREYRHSARTPLGARYERLMNEAERKGLRASVSLADFQAWSGAGSTTLGSEQLLTSLTRSVSGHRSAEERTRVVLQMICATYAAPVGHLYLFSSTGLVLSTSHGAEVASPKLTELVSDFVAIEGRRALELDEMLTGEAADDVPFSTTVQFSGSDYEILPLRCVVEGVALLAGVAIAATHPNLQRSHRHVDLLQALASTLMQTGDSRGMRLSTGA